MVAPVDQRKEPPVGVPVAEMVALCPEHNEILLVVTVGTTFTVTNVLPVEEQPSKVYVKE